MAVRAPVRGMQIVEEDVAQVGLIVMDMVFVGGDVGYGGLRSLLKKSGYGRRVGIKISSG